MTTRFVSAATGSNSNNGSTWALAKQTVAGAISISSSGDTIVVDNAGTFTANTTITWTPAGNLGIISVTRSGTTGFTPSAGAVETTGTGGAFTIANPSSSSLYVYGMTVSGGSAGGVIVGSSQNANASTWLDTCTLQGSSSSSTITLGVSASVSVEGIFIRLDNCTFSQTATSVTGSNFFGVGCGVFEIVNPTLTIASGSTYTSMFALFSANTHANITIRDGDLSTGNIPIFSVTNWSSAVGFLTNCKIGSNGVTTGSWPDAYVFGSITARNCDSANTTNTFRYVTGAGTLTADSTNVTGGASFNGTGISWKIVTNANVTALTPFVLPVIEIWSTSTSAQTAKIEIANTASHTYTDQEIWFEIDYASNATHPDHADATSRNSQPITGTANNYTTSSATWNGITANPEQFMTASFTALQASYLIQARIYVARASATLYIDPTIYGVT